MKQWRSQVSSEDMVQLGSEFAAGPHSTDHRGICGWKMMEMGGNSRGNHPRDPARTLTQCRVSFVLARMAGGWRSQYFPDPPGSRNSRDSRWVHHFKQQFLKVCLSIVFMISIIRLVFVVLNHLSNFWYPVTPVT